MAARTSTWVPGAAYASVSSAAARGIGSRTAASRAASLRLVTLARGAKSTARNCAARSEGAAYREACVAA